MKTPAIILAAAIALAPAAALAQTQANTGEVRTRLDLAGDAPAACVLSQPSASNNTNASVDDTGAHSTEVIISQLVDANTLTAQAATVNLAFPLICNGPHTLTVTTGNGGLALEGGAPAAPGFTDHVNYTLEAAWAGQTSTTSTATTKTLQINTGDGAAGVVSLSIQIPGGGSRLIAGSYSDTLTLEVQPAT
jgi:hypothetical protein